MLQFRLVFFSVSLLAAASRQEKFVDHCNDAIEYGCYRRPEKRVRLIRILCGLLFQVVTIYTDHT
ncbi:MAG: hypothetical protein LBP59_05065 [Planctomycetaceae bacterium]|nr:hypothetical protein [Planctomycetaceae bacterium]